MLTALKLLITTRCAAMALSRNELDRVDFSDVASGEALPLAHPGEILNEDFLKPLGISQYRLATAIGVPPRRINEIVKGQRGITADTAVRLAAFFETDAQSWINLQAYYDAERAKTLLADVLTKIKPYREAEKEPES